MSCPQCGAQLGEGAKGCAACGWSSSKKTLWIVLGSIFGFLFLVCCGGATWLGFKAKSAVEGMQAKATPVIVTYHRVAVLNYAQARGELPASLREAASEPLQMDKHGGGGSNEFKFEMQQDGKDMDTWQRPLRYTAEDDGTYEVRSAGPDGVFDNEDDIFQAGSMDDDLDEAKAAFQKEAEEIGKEFLRGLGINPDEMETKESPGPVDPAEPVPPEPADEGGGGDGDGGGDDGGK